MNLFCNNNTISPNILVLVITPVIKIKTGSNLLKQYDYQLIAVKGTGNSICIFTKKAVVSHIGNSSKYQISVFLFPQRSIIALFTTQQHNNYSTTTMSASTDDTKRVLSAQAQFTRAQLNSIESEFKLADKNKDGSLDFEEFKRVFRDIPVC